MWEILSKLLNKKENEENGIPFYYVTREMWCDIFFLFFFFFNCVNVFIGNLDATICGRLYVSDLSYRFRMDIIILIIIFEISKSSS